jgi:hypothetical protein
MSCQQTHDEMRLSLYLSSLHASLDFYAMSGSIDVDGVIALVAKIFHLSIKVGHVPSTTLAVNIASTMRMTGLSDKSHKLLRDVK